VLIEVLPRSGEIASWILPNGMTGGNEFHREFRFSVMWFVCNVVIGQSYRSCNCVVFGRGSGIGYRFRSCRRLTMPKVGGHNFGTRSHLAVEIIGILGE
jgi:hypothetical protein